MQVDTAVVLLAEESESKSVAPVKKTKTAPKSESATNVLNQVQMQLESLQRKVNDVNNDIGK